MKNILEETKENIKARILKTSRKPEKNNANWMKFFLQFGFGYVTLIKLMADMRYWSCAIYLC